MKAIMYSNNLLKKTTFRKIFVVQIVDAFIYPSVAENKNV